MEPYNSDQLTPRRGFLGALTTGVALSAATLASPFQAQAETLFPTAENSDSPDAWFDSIKGKHRMVFDVPEPHDILPFAWPRVFLVTNVATGTAEKENNAVVVFRHNGIPYAFEDRLWEKYKFGEVFKANDPATKAPATRNLFWKPKQGDYNLPGVGELAIGINELQASGVMFCVCDVAMTVYSAAVASAMNMTPEAVKKDWLAGLLPGVKVVPSGVWALGRAQEKGCAYIFAG